MNLKAHKHSFQCRGLFAYLKQGKKRAYYLYAPF